MLRQSRREEKRGNISRRPQPALWTRSHFNFFPAVPLLTYLFSTGERTYLRNPQIPYATKSRERLLKGFYISIDEIIIYQVPKTRRTYCKGKECKKHTQHKVTQYKAGKVLTHSNPLLPSTSPEQSLRTYIHPYLTSPHLTSNNTTTKHANPPRSTQTGILSRPRQAPLRPQTVRLRRPNEARLPQEGKDDQEGGAEAGMHEL